LIGFYDDHKKGFTIEGLPVLGGIDDVNNLSTETSLLIAIADGHVRAELVSRINNSLVDFPVLIHPNVIVGSKQNQFGRGCIVTAGCVFTTGIRLDEFVIVNLSSTVGHDVSIGPYSSIMPGCNISGGVSIGRKVLVGSGSCILQGLVVEDDCRIGAGAVVTRNVPAGKTVVGVPAKDIDVTKI